MLGPFLTYGRRVEIALRLEPRLSQQLLGPFAQRPTQPRVNRDAEPHLRTFDQIGRHVSVEKLSKKPFALAAADLHAQRQRPRELRDAMVEKRRARLDAHAHRRAIDLVK